jgi:exodeoxyribonuclease V beta subunit
MSAHRLDALHFPLHGSRLIEASAGTGKTWTIAALVLRLVLGPDLGPDPDRDIDSDSDPAGAGNDFARPLLPAEILVMTFTRAATRELAGRVRERLIEAAAHFRGTNDLPADDYLAALLAAYPAHEARQQAAHRLMLAAETMDEAAIFTIDAWCQRMLREHAFDSGSLFDEQLLNDEHGLFDDAAHDYWRQQVYPLDAAGLDVLLACWPDVNALKSGVRELVKRADLLAGDDSDAGFDPDAVMNHDIEPLAELIVRLLRQQACVLATLKAGWVQRADRMEQWVAVQRGNAPKCFNGNKMRPESLRSWFAGLRDWAGDAGAVMPELNDTAWRRLTPEGILDACAKGFSVEVPDDFDAIVILKQALDGLEPLGHGLLRHGALAMSGRMQALKRSARQFGFADLPLRLENALLGENGAALRQRITQQYPVALVDEFQDTAPGQYRILDLLYRVADNDRAHGLFLIGDPKQSIYGFRGADIHSYLAARSATEGRHYRLDTNFRSTHALVGAVNALFLHAEGDGFDRSGFAAGAFRFRNKNGNPGNPLPFDAVNAQGRDQQLRAGGGALMPLTIACHDAQELKADAYRTFFAHHCAEHIVALLNDPQAGFYDGAGAAVNFVRLQPADIAVLVRDRNEAQAIRKALQQRHVASVYLSDKDSVVDSLEAADVLRWLSALAHAEDGALARAAFATRTIGLSLAELTVLACDELAWEERTLQIKAWHLVWQRQGVLAMLRRLIHELGLPAALLQQPGGERRLTNLLHLAELLQSASRQLDGEQALIRWLGEQIEGHGDGMEERVLRLESDAELVQVVTVHKSKGLEYPLVYLPFGVTARKVDKRNRSYFEFTDAAGKRHIDLALSDAAQQAVEAARIDEDVRLLYVAATRARHMLWLGVAAQAGRKAGENTLHDSAFGYLLAGGEPVALDQLAARCADLRTDCSAIEVQILGHADAGATPLSRMQGAKPLIDAARFEASFERDWTVGSFTSLTRQIGSRGGNPASTVSFRAPARALEETLLEDQDGDDDASGLPRAFDASGSAPYHHFPRGSVPGNFLHEQLEWLAGCGFKTVDDAHFATRLGARCERAGWGHRQQDVVTWLRAIAATPLPMLGVALNELDMVLPEMEFWCPSERLDSGALDRLCTSNLLGDTPRPALPGRTLHGMLKGFADLVFEHEGRYWVLDYKSNWLGPGDGAYHKQALAQGMAQHRYDIQGALYMQALHRLLGSRMGALYRPQQHLGGAIFLFLRGIAHPHTHGCFVLEPEAALLDGLDRLLSDAASNAAGEPDEH